MAAKSAPAAARPYGTVTAARPATPLAARPPPRRNRTGLIIASVLVGILLIAGGATAAFFLMQGGSSKTPLEIAQAAALQLETDQAAGGKLSGETAKLTMDSTGSPTIHMEMTMRLTAYTGDAMQMALTFDRMTVNGQSQLQGATMTIFCTPKLLVLKTTGLAIGGGKDADAETANDAGKCMGKGLDQSAFLRSMTRLANTMGGSIGPSLVNGFSKPSSTSDATRHTVSAKATPKGVEAVYSMTVSGSSTNMTATIQDGRIISERGSISPPAGTSGSMAVQITYSYTARSSAPDQHGAQKV